LDLDAETKELIASSHRQVHAMRRLLDDLLDVTRVTQGKFQLRPVRADLCALIDHSIKATTSLFDRGHDFAVVTPCTEPFWIEVDPVRFEQALVNLLNNAAKYTEPGGRITISHARKGNMLTLMVKDNGIGIDREHLESIFQPFWQAGMLPSQSSGVGIGLSLTRHIIELHGGSVHADSSGRGKGSTFTIKLPIPADDSAPQQAPKRTAAARTSFKVLVVDDNHAAADALVKLLKLKGHEARATYAGMDAVLQIKDYAPEIVILDIGLPDISGYEVAESMRRDGYAGKIIALSGYGQQEDRERSKQAGCDEHFIKPMSITRFEDYLAEMRNS
jgi:CheY-like chemotaxis protein